MALSCPTDTAALWLAVLARTSVPALLFVLATRFGFGRLQSAFKMVVWCMRIMLISTAVFSLRREVLAVPSEGGAWRLSYCSFHHGAV